MRPPQPYPNYSHYYHQHPPPVAPAQPDFQMQMMWKILEEFKSLFKMQTEASINDKTSPGKIRMGQGVLSLQYGFRGIM